MGTRNLTVVVVNKQIVVAQYGQWDGYPNGQGKRIAEFLRTKYDREAFLAGLARAQYVDDEFVDALWLKHGAHRGADGSISANLDVCTKIAAAAPSLDRDMGGKVLEFIQTDAKPLLRTDAGFAADSLFCEFAYVVDLDTNTLEIYKGFNKAPLAAGERFAYLESESEGEYHPVKFLTKIPFAALRHDTMALLQEKLDNEEEIEEAAEVDALATPLLEHLQISDADVKAGIAKVTAELEPVLGLKAAAKKVYVLSVEDIEAGEWFRYAFAAPPTDAQVQAFLETEYPGYNLEDEIGYQVEEVALTELPTVD